MFKLQKRQNFAMVRLLLCLCLLAVSVSAAVPDLKSLVDAQYRDWVAAHPWVGIAVGIIHPNFTTPQFFSYGHQNGPISPWINPDTMFAINSMTKVFTSTVLAQNAMQGRVELSDFVQKYTQHPLATDAGQSFEFLDLATHWSGLPTRPTNLPNPDYINYTDTQFYDFMQSYNFSSLHVRKQYWYSNCAFGLLANVFAGLDQTNFIGLMNRYIFSQLNMTRSDLVTMPRYDPFVATGHAEDGTPLPPGTSCESVLGSWAIRSTAKDILKFLAEHLAVNSVPQPPLTWLDYAMLLAQKEQRTTDDPAYEIGLGWRVHTATRTRIKTGSGDGFESTMMYQGQKQVAMVVLSNAYLPAPHDVDTTAGILWDQLLNM